ncbi:hypothetical protein BGZ98_004385, partial [Dissophora globulifera]
AARAQGGSWEKGGQWRSDSRRDPGSKGPFPAYGSPRGDGGSRGQKLNEDRGAASGQRSTRQVIPLPPKPAASLDANHRPQIERSRSPSYRAHSPLPASGGPRREDTRQTLHSPLIGSNRSLSPHKLHPTGGLSTQSHSPHLPTRAHMDQLSPSRDQSARRSRDPAADGRWEKTPHEDKPYPSQQPPPAPVASPKDDIIYFRRREGRNINDPPSQARGTMYHERLEVEEHRSRSFDQRDTSNDRWGKNTVAEPDRPYPERHTSTSGTFNNNNSQNNNSSKAKSRGQPDISAASPSPPISQRGHRGKGKDQQKRRSKDQPVAVIDDNHSQGKDDGASVPWWEQSTYNSKKKEEASKMPSSTATPVAPIAAESEPKKDAPWWEQSTYKLKPRTDTVDQVASRLGSVDLKSNSTAPASVASHNSAVEAATMARRKALGQVSPESGVEALTLVSRGDDSG